jgi:hypothetical protein
MGFTALKARGTSTIASQRQTAGRIIVAILFQHASIAISTKATEMVRPTKEILNTLRGEVGRLIPWDCRKGSLDPQEERELLADTQNNY